MSFTPQISRRSVVLLAFIALVASIIWQHNRSESRGPSNAETSTKTVNVAARPSTSSQREAITEADRRMIEEKALTDMTVSVFPAREYAHQPQPAGKSAGAPAGQAYIHVPSIGRRVSMEPNQIGEFPTIETKLKDTVGVRLLLDDVKPGTPVRIAIMDGGTFPSKEGLAQIIRASDQRGISFEFTTSINIGYHRILVEAQGYPARLLNFSAHDASWPALTQSPTN
jgi:hypothetical protein